MAYTCIKNELCTIGKLVMREDRTVIPNTLRMRVLEVAHKGTKSRLRTKVWWPKMDSDAERICKSCHGFEVVGQLNVPEPMQ